MKINSHELLNDLKEITLSIITRVEKMKTEDSISLNKKVNNDSWSALECIEHLNRYGRFYIPEIIHRISHAKRENDSTFKSGWLGNYFAKSMLPSEKMKPIKTFASMNPAGSTLDKTVIDEFLEQQQQLLRILETSKAINLIKTKTAISISKWIKLRLGDTLRVVIYHNERHIQQANKALRG